MNILITGSNGQLGNSLKKIQHKYPMTQCTFTDIDTLDITDIDAIRKFSQQKDFQCIINCAAYTAVDKAEEEPASALRINAGAPENLARVATEINALLIHISTDYVFDGYHHTPYHEEDDITAVSVYGKTKAEGESRVQQEASKAVIIRTSWLYSEFGHNFLKTIARLAPQKEELSVVYDQIGSPTYATDLAHAIMQVVSKPVSPGTTIYHYTNEGVCSWYDFACTIVNLSGAQCRVKPIETKDYPLPAPRPPYSVLNKEKIKHALNINIPHWQDSVKTCFTILHDTNRA